MDQHIRFCATLRHADAKAFEVVVKIRGRAFLRRFQIADRNFGEVQNLARYWLARMGRGSERLCSTEIKEGHIKSALLRFSEALCSAMKSART